jgi:rSAM/selenodomain-associated transferase 1
MPASDSRVVAVMARPPAIGISAIKTRLATAIPSEADRVGLYRAFLEDTVGACRRVAATTVKIAYTPEGSAEHFAAFGVAPSDLLPQRGRSLGDRERHLFEDLFGAGASAAVVIGSDLPTLPPAHLEAAFDELAADPSAVVLGPSADGGYYLIGLTEERPSPPVDLFHPIRWSTRFALEDTLAGAARCAIPVRLVPAWYDVDDAEGLDRLRRALHDRDVARRAPATVARLGSMGIT